PVATREQFARAYPNSRVLFETKRRVDPTGKFTNALWDLYQPNADGAPTPVNAAHMPANISAEARIVLDTVKGYAREEGADFLTHPEWDLVYGSEAYARWLEEGKRPSQFAYIGAVGTFWRSYHDTFQAAKGRYSVSMATHVMLNVIGVSTAIEYGLKGIYEGTLGRVFEPWGTDGGTDEDKYAAKVARDYATLITTRGWYEFSFGGALRGLWRDVPMSGPGILRKWERRFALSSEYLIKAAYATVIGAGTSAGYTPDVLTRYAVVAGWDDSLATVPVAAGTGDTLHTTLRTDTLPEEQTLTSRFRKVMSLDRGYTLVAVNRYNPYRDALLELSNHANRIRLAEIAGAAVVTLSGTAPKTWRANPRTSVVVAYTTPDDSTRTRMLLKVQARDLLDVLARMRRDGQFRVDHIYDY
ncbi:MAG: hypothetical protein ABI120_19930, partial [Gemmatimonadaceae bacterium]